MDFISNRDTQIDEMLAFLGIQKIDELFDTIPDALRLKKIVEDDGLSEYEGLKLMENLAAKNTFLNYENYLGGGAYEHYVPALVEAICSKSGFLTSYTPYQPEVSQGMLQVIFEFQSAICALTGLDAANASVYDASSACVEGIMMALRFQKTRNKVLIAESINPHYKEVIEQYLRFHDYIIEWIPFNASQIAEVTQIEKLIEKSGDNIAAILMQSPNFFGVLESMKEISSLARQKRIVTILCSDLMAYGLLNSAQELDIDIAVGDCQSFGIPMQFGGPYAGYISCRQEFIRQLPGRLVGETVDSQNKRGFVLTLQAREQHIRREKATSNICTNQGLNTLASLIAMLWYGKKGIPALALTNYQRASYLKKNLFNLPNLQANSKRDNTTFNEFVVEFNKPIEEVQKHFRLNGIEPGIHLGQYFPSLNSHLLIAVTETKSKDQLDRYIEVAKKIV